MVARRLGAFVVGDGGARQGQSEFGLLSRVDLGVASVGQMVGKMRVLPQGGVESFLALPPGH